MKKILLSLVCCVGLLSCSKNTNLEVTTMPVKNKIGHNFVFEHKIMYIHDTDIDNTGAGFIVNVIPELNGRTTRYTNESVNTTELNIDSIKIRKGSTNGWLRVNMDNVLYFETTIQDDTIFAVPK